MTGMFRRNIAAASVALAVATSAAVVVIATSAPEVVAHGSTQVPASRVHACRFDQPGNSMCSQASAANPQAIYDWMEVNIGDADGRHRDLIPDGQLCSAGRSKYAAFDEPGDWPLTHLQSNSSGEYEVVYVNTAPHATAYYRLMLTKPGFDARTDRLNWDDLEQVYESGPLPAAEQNRFTVQLPARSEPAILYVIWQRSDSPEAFYSCSDVTIGGSSGGTGGDSESPPAAPSTTSPSPTSPPETPAPSTTSTPSTPSTPPPSPDPAPPSSAADVPNPTAGEDLETTETVTASWDRGYCTEIRVRNATSEPLTWEVRYQPRGSIDTLWNAEGDEREGAMTFAGEAWNRSIPGGQWTSFGMCVSRE